MRKFVIAFVFTFALSFTANARTCSKCNGSGRMKIFYELSTYGISRDKKQCPICKQWIPVGTEHTETCDRCGGTGRVETAMDRRNAERSSRMEDAAAEGLSYLNPGELAQYQALQEMLKGHMENVDCQTCNKTGRCMNCNGSGYTLDGNMCYLCSSTGKCMICYGTGISGSRYVEPSAAEKQEILKKMGQLVSNAMNRENGNSSVSSAYENGDETTSPSHSKDKRSSVWGWIFAIAVVAFIIYRKFRK